MKVEKINIGNKNSFKRFNFRMLRSTLFSCKCFPSLTKRGTLINDYSMKTKIHFSDKNNCWFYSALPPFPCVLIILFLLSYHYWWWCYDFAFIECFSGGSWDSILTQLCIHNLLCVNNPLSLSFSFFNLTWLWHHLYIIKS